MIADKPIFCGFRGKIGASALPEKVSAVFRPRMRQTKHPILSSGWGALPRHCEALVEKA